MPFWYFEKDGVRQGPVSDTRLCELARSGDLSPETLLKTGILAEGKARQVNGLLSRAKAYAYKKKAYCSQCGAAVPRGARRCPECRGWLCRPTSTKKGRCYCTACGSKLGPEQTVCLFCGANPKGHRYCRGCGTRLYGNQPVCFHCGTPVRSGRGEHFLPKYPRLPKSMIKQLSWEESEERRRLEEEHKHGFLAELIEDVAEKNPESGEKMRDTVKWVRKMNRRLRRARIVSLVLFLFAAALTAAVLYDPLWLHDLLGGLGRTLSRWTRALFGLL